MDIKIDKVFVKDSMIRAAEITVSQKDVFENLQSITLTCELLAPIEFSDESSVEDLYIIKQLNYLLSTLQQTLFIKIDGVAKTIGAQEHLL